MRAAANQQPSAWRPVAVSTVWPYISVSSAGSTRELPYERRRELRKDRVRPDFVGYDTRSDQPERRVTAAPELGIRWSDYLAVERR